MNDQNTTPAVVDFKLWNPNAAANWSLVFTPVFGAYLHARNWRAMGQNERAAGSMKWFYGGLVLYVLFLLIFLLVNDDKIMDGVGRLLGFTYLLVWYFASARAQAKFVKEKYGATYPRKTWGKPLLIGFGCRIAYLLLAVVVGLILGTFRGT